MALACQISRIRLFSFFQLRELNVWHITCMLLAQYLSCNLLIIVIIILMATGRNQYTDGEGCNGKKRINEERQGFIYDTGFKAV